MEKRSHPMWRYVVCVLLVALVFAVYVLRLYDWQILNGSTWLATADHSTQSTVAIPAARGEKGTCKDETTCWHPHLRRRLPGPQRHHSRRCESAV